MARKIQKSKLTRNKDGTFRNWKGGENKTYHGTRVNIGKEYARQKGRPAKVGDIVRDKNTTGKYNKGSPWHIRTPYGWRKSPTLKKKPTKAQINKVLERSKPGRGK